MNIVVLLKQTPDTESVIRIAGDGRSIETQDIKWIINPYDEFAVEAALRLKEQQGGTVTIVSWGPQRVVESIRTALAMGADKGMLIDDEALEESDSLGIAKVLAAAVQELNPDIVLCGHRAVDYDHNQRGPMVAELLGWPHLPLAVSLECDGTTVKIERPVEGGKMVVESSLPAVVTMGGSHAVWNPRYASLPGIMKARKKPLDVKKLADLGLNPEECGSGAAKIRLVSLEMPPERKPGRIINGDLDTEGKAKELVRALREEAKVI